MKNSILFLVATALFVIGGVLKFTHLPLGGTFFGVSFILLIIYTIVIYVKRFDSIISKILMVSFSVFMAALSFSLIQHRDFKEIFIASITVGLMTIGITVTIRFIKSKSSLDK